MVLADQFGGLGPASGGTFLQDPALEQQALDLGAGLPPSPQLAMGPIAAPVSALDVPSVGQVGVGVAQQAAIGGATAGPLGAGIAGGLALVGGLLSQSAAKARQERELKLRGTLKGLETERQAAVGLASGTQGALRDILAGLSRSLG